MSHTVSDVYTRLGVATIINAWAPMTRFGGGVMGSEVADAMREATQFCVDMPSLQARAAAIIAEVTGAESGCVTAGASAALLLGAAACLTGWDPARMERLPDTRGMKNEVVVARSQRNSYDHALRATGAVLVEVGLADRITGTGTRDAEPWEYAAAIGEQTAAVYYLARPGSSPSLEAVVEVAHRAGVPVIVDAAAELPPASNLRAFTATGADLVAFSGGKAIGGPQGSGFLCGRSDLIGPALLQQLDLDYDFASWSPPGPIVKDRLPGLPRNGIGRSCKVAKEQIIGALVALRLFASQGECELSAARRRAAALRDAVASVRSLSATLVDDPEGGSTLPLVRVQMTSQSAVAMDAPNLAKKLAAGSPSILVNPALLSEGALLLSPACLRPEDTKTIVRRLGELLGCVPDTAILSAQETRT